MSTNINECAVAAAIRTSGYNDSLVNPSEITLNRNWHQIAFLLLLLTVLPTASGTEDAQQPHSPIVIANDLGLLLPDAVAQNGVRGGTGLATDPWVISDWTIEAPMQGAAVSITGVTGFLVIEHLVIDMPEGAIPTHGVNVRDSPNIVIRNVEFTGVGDPLTFFGSSVSASNLIFNSKTPYVCVSAVGGSLSMAATTMDDSCGVLAIAVRDADLYLEDFHAMGPGAGISASKPNLVQIRGSSIRIEPGPPRQDDLSVGANALQITYGANTQVSVSDSVIEGASSACIRIMGESGSPSFDLARLAFRNCGASRQDAGLRIERTDNGRVLLSNSSLVGNAVGIRLFEGRVDVQSSLFQDNGVAIHARNFDDATSPAAAHVRVSRSTLTGNGIDAQADYPASIELQNSWNDGPLRGNVTVVSPATNPPVASQMPDSRESPLVSPALLAVILLLALFKRPRVPSRWQSLW